MGFLGCGRDFLEPAKSRLQRFLNKTEIIGDSCSSIIFLECPRNMLYVSAVPRCLFLFIYIFEHRPSCLVPH